MTNLELAEVLRRCSSLIYQLVHVEEGAPAILNMAAGAIEELTTENLVLRMRDIPMVCTHQASLAEACTCPSCNNVVSSKEQWGDSVIDVVPKYCPYCGQRIIKEEETIEHKSFCIDPDERFEL